MYPCFNRLSLWSFIFDLLEEKQKACVKWTDRENLEFKIEDTEGLAFEWGSRKGRHSMTWPKFARAMRYYYGKNVLEKVERKRFTYKFIDSPKTRPVFQQRRQKNNNTSSVGGVGKLAMVPSPISSTTSTYSPSFQPLISDDDFKVTTTAQSPAYSKNTIQQAPLFLMHNSNTYEKERIDLIRKELEISVTSSSEESNDSASFYSTSCYASKYQQQQQQQQQQNITWPNICFNTTLNSSINFLPQYQTPLHQLQQQQLLTIHLLAIRRYPPTTTVAHSTSISVMNISVLHPPQQPIRTSLTIRKPSKVRTP